MGGLDLQQRRTLTWAGLAVVLTAFDGSVLVLALPAIASDFHARTPALSNLGSVLAVGSLGALPLAALADRFGRRRLIAIGVAGFSLANFASGLANSLEALAVLRLIAVCFEALVGGVATALVVEEAPVARRGQAVSVLALLGGLGTGITVIAYPLLAPHWRWLFLAGGAGVLFAPAIWFRLPEGRRWLGVQVTGSALRLLLQPPWRRRVAVVAAMTALLAVLLEPAGLLFTVYASDVLRLSPAAISVLIVVSGIAGAAFYLVGGYLTDRYGRRAPAIALTLAIALATSLSFATATVGFYADACQRRHAGLRGVDRRTVSDPRPSHGRGNRGSGRSRRQHRRAAGGWVTFAIHRVGPCHRAVRNRGNRWSLLIAHAAGDQAGSAS